MNARYLQVLLVSKLNITQPLPSETQKNLYTIPNMITLIDHKVIVGVVIMDFCTSFTGTHSFKRSETNRNQPSK